MIISDSGVNKMKAYTYSVSNYLGNQFDFKLVHNRKILAIVGMAAIGKTQTLELLNESLKVSSSINPPVVHLAYEHELNQVVEGLYNSLTEVIYFIDGDNFQISQIEKFVKDTYSTRARYILLLRQEDASWLNEYQSVSILTPNRSRYTYHFAPLLDYVNPPLDELDISDSVCITEDAGSGFAAFKLAFPAVISSCGAGRLDDVLKSVLYITCKPVVVIADRDTSMYLQEALRNLNPRVNVYVLIHSSTEYMLCHASDLLNAACKTVMQSLTFDQISSTLLKIYKTAQITSERVDLVLYYLALLHLGIQVNPKNLKLSHYFNPGKLGISGESISAYIRNSLKSDRDSVEKSDELFTYINTSEQDSQEPKDYLFSSPPESQDSDSPQLD